MSQATIQPKHTNALAHETSPYLLQHAHNPVNWLPWGPEAMALARREDKPIFLSVGYSSCHWCHVMERESFEDEELAAFLNEHFVPVKVDREERPDVDEIYMAAVQLYGKHGGWPMSVFMTAEGKPFFGGTYFPPVDRAGHIGFRTLLQRINELWVDRRQELLKDAEALTQGVQEYLGRQRHESTLRLFEGAQPSAAIAEVLENAVSSLHANFDAQHGGFSERPKFPPSNVLPLLLHLQRKNPGQSAVREMVTRTLEAMAHGGIHDQLGGGFHRYSTDRQWLLPHFEKMLYDNALLSGVYAEAAGVYANEEYARVARGAYDWVLREMTSPEGGFYSTLDADSEGHEGKFYVWSQAEIEAALGPDAELFCQIFDVRKHGNFQEEASGESTGLNILHLPQALSEQARARKLSEDSLRSRIEQLKARLLAVRSTRVRPSLDDKMLTSWNALMISSLARGAMQLSEDRYKAAAVKAAEFLLKNLRTSEGRWLASFRAGQAKLPAYLDDHAFLAVAFLDLFDATGAARWRDEAMALMELLQTRFADSSGGGYFFTADDHEQLIARVKDPVDKAIPSGNGMALQALLRLHVLTKRPDYLRSAIALVEEFQALLERVPQATSSLLLALAQLELPQKAAPQVKPAGNLRVNRGPVIVQVKVSRCEVKRGATVPIEIQLAVDQGWHIQAAGSGPGQAGALRIGCLPEELATLEGLSYPEPEELKSAALGALKVYSGQVTIEAVSRIQAHAPSGSQLLKLRVHFQACNDRVCERPEEVTLEVPLEIEIS